MILRAAILGTAIHHFEASEDLAEKISRFAPRSLSPDDVHVRAFLAANSRPSKDGILRIRDKAIRKLAKLYPGAPLMRNHDMMWAFSMPVGRVFDARTQTADDKATELVLPFYVAKNDPTGDQIAKYIDTGIYSESSIHGYFSSADCSICGKSLDETQKEHCSEHNPGDEYGGETAMIELDDPTEAPEFSLCWSGRLAGTRALSQPVPGTLTVREFVERRSGWIASIAGRRKPETNGKGGWLDSILVTRAA